MTHKKYRRPTFLNDLDPLHALRLEAGITDGQYLINNEDLRLDIDSDGECQPDIHSTRIGLHWLLDELADVCKRRDVVDTEIDFLLGQSQQGAVHVNVFATREFWIESSPKFEECRHTTIGVDYSTRRRKSTADDLQQGGFTGPIASDDADRF